MNSNSHYEVKGTWGSTLTLEFNNDNSGAAAHDVLLTATGSTRDTEVYASVTGEKAIREFLYSFAVIGGIIKEGETLELIEPSRREVPEDGLYKLTGASKDRPVAMVQEGRVMVPQPEQGTLVDFTDTYLSKYSQWELTPLVRTERSYE